MGDNIITNYKTAFFIVLVVLETKSLIFSLCLLALFAFE